MPTLVLIFLWQPMTTRDFMNYLVYVEHAAENLQFYLWYKDYEKRFEAARKTDTSLAPEWTQTMQVDTQAEWMWTIQADNMDQVGMVDIDNVGR